MGNQTGWLPSALQVDAQPPSHIDQGKMIALLNLINQWFSARGDFGPGGIGQCLETSEVVSEG